MSPAPTVTPNATTTPNPTLSPEPTVTPNPTTTPNPTLSPEPTVTPNPTTTPNPTLSPAPTVTPEPTLTPEPTQTPEPTVTPDPTPTTSETPYPTHTPLPTFTPNPTLSPNPTITPNPTLTPEPTVTPEATTTPVPTLSPEPTVTPEATTTPVPTLSPEPTVTPAATTTPVPTLSPEPTVTPEATTTPAPTLSPEPTVTPEATATPVPTVTAQATATPLPTNSPSPTPSPSPTNSPSPTPSPSTTPTPTSTSATATPTLSPAKTPTPTPSPSRTPSPTPTPSPTNCFYALNYADYTAGTTIGNAVMNGANVSDDYFGPNAYDYTMNPLGNWTAPGAIYSQDYQKNCFNRNIKQNTSSSTFNGGGSAASPFNIVLDLGQIRTFDMARYYQTFSDGKCTHAALDYSTSGNLETRTSANWAQIHAFVLLDNSDTSEGVAGTFSLVTARYLRIRLYNDGRYEDNAFTELYSFKLFDTTGVPTPTPSGTGPTPTLTPSPTPTPSPTRTSTPTPTLTPSPTPTAGIDIAYSLFGWGEWFYANNSTLQVRSPVQTTLSGTDWELIGRGNLGQYGSAVKSGILYMWGSNTYGQLGTNNIINRSVPVQTVLDTNPTWTSLANGYRFFAGLDATGKIWIWGENTNGQLGDNTTVHRSSPAQLGTSADWAAIAAGVNAISAIKKNGTLWSWGNNSYGQLGVGTSTNRSSPVQVGTDNTWSKIAFRSYGGIAIKTDGSLWSWGFGSQGQIGNNLVTAYASPVNIGVGYTWRSIAGGQHFAAAIRSDGTLWSWGSNVYGQLGNGTLTHRSIPVQIGTDTNWTDIVGTQLGMGALKSDNTLWNWGYQGNLGNNPTGNASSPVQTTKNDNLWWGIGSSGRALFGIRGVKPTATPSPTASPTASPTPTPSSTASPTPTPSSTASPTPTPSSTAPTPTPTSTSTPTPSPTAFVPPNSRLWSMGNNTIGHLGDNTKINKSVPVQEISNSITWSSLSVGSTAYAVAGIKADGTLWLWGHNSYGLLGSNSLIHRSSPTQTVAGGTNWSTVTVGGLSAFAIKTDGTLWGWGYNSGNLINNSGFNVSSPIQIGSETNWSKVSTNGFSVAAIKKNGSLWLWGQNDIGQLGDNTVIHRSSPVQVITGGTWTSVACASGSFAGIKTDNTLWTWGYNYPGGTLGDGTGINRSSPVQIVTGGTWLSVSCGSSSFNAIKSDNTLWTWGANSYGSLGNNIGGIYNYLSSPVQITGGGLWSKSVMAGINGAGIKTDGTLWTWGVNTFGQVGDNTKIHRSSPVQTTIQDNLWYDLSAVYIGTSPIENGISQIVGLRRLPSHYLYYSGNSTYVSGTTITDESDRINTGTMTSSSIYTTGCPGVFNFNGTSDMINSKWIHYPSDINIITLSVWIKTTDTNGRKIIGRENIATGTGATSYDRQLWVGSNGLPYFGLGVTTIAGTFAVNDGAWHHIVGTFSPNNMAIYVDGVQQSTSTTPASGENTSGYWRIGGQKLTGWTNGSDGYFKGQMANIAVYPTALTSGQVSSLYNSQLSLMNMIEFDYTGSLQTYQVPAGVYQLTASLIGAKGGNAGSAVGGGGAIINTDISVTPGEILYLVVGGTPATGATNYLPTYGFGGTGGNAGSSSSLNGGGGGGLSGIFRSSNFEPSSIVAIAAGGGGGTPKSTGTGGGAGGGPNGANGGEYNGSFGINAGYGATQTAPGNAGSQYDGYVNLPGAGSYLYGGAGARSSGAYNNGGAGGAGYYGGGGGTGGGDATGGAGGGSSYSIGTVSYPTSKNTIGDGRIVISFGCLPTVGTKMLLGWGGNSFGVLGLGDTANRNNPTFIIPNLNWKDIGGI